jgi:hypothetical protein
MKPSPGPIPHAARELVPRRASQEVGDRRISPLLTRAPAPAPRRPPLSARACARVPPRSAAAARPPRAAGQAGGRPVCARRRWPPRADGGRELVRLQQWNDLAQRPVGRREVCQQRLCDDRISAAAAGERTAGLPGCPRPCICGLHGGARRPRRCMTARGGRGVSSPPCRAAPRHSHPPPHPLKHPHTRPTPRASTPSACPSFLRTSRRPPRR